jgi:hypothetical protein
MNKYLCAYVRCDLSLQSHIHAYTYTATAPARCHHARHSRLQWRHTYAYTHTPHQLITAVMRATAVPWDAHIYSRTCINTAPEHCHHARHWWLQGRKP